MESSADAQALRLGGKSDEHAGGAGAQDGDVGVVQQLGDGLAGFDRATGHVG